MCDVCVCRVSVMRVVCNVCVYHVRCCVRVSICPQHTCVCIGAQINIQLSGKYGNTYNFRYSNIHFKVTPLSHQCVQHNDFTMLDHTYTYVGVSYFTCVSLHAYEINMK